MTGDPLLDLFASISKRSRYETYQALALLVVQVSTAVYGFYVGSFAWVGFAVGVGLAVSSDMVVNYALSGSARPWQNVTDAMDRIVREIKDAQNTEER